MAMLQQRGDAVVSVIEARSDRKGDLNIECIIRDTGGESCGRKPPRTVAYKGDPGGKRCLPQVPVQRPRTARKMGISCRLVVQKSSPARSFRETWVIIPEGILTEPWLATSRAPKALTCCLAQSVRAAPKSPKFILPLGLFSTCSVLQD